MKKKLREIKKFKLSFFNKIQQSTKVNHVIFAVAIYTNVLCEAQNRGIIPREIVENQHGLQIL